MLKLITVLKMKYACIMCLAVLSSLLNLTLGVKSETGAEEPCGVKESCEAEESCGAEIGLIAVEIHLLGKVDIASIH